MRIQRTSLIWAYLCHTPIVQSRPFMSSGVLTKQRWERRKRMEGDVEVWVYQKPDEEVGGWM